MSVTYVPIRLQIMRQLQALIEGATFGEGSLAGRVSRGKILMGDEIPQGPWVNIIEAPRPDFPSFTANEARLDDWVILLEGSIERDEQGQSDPAYILQAEVELQLSKVFLTSPTTGRPAYPEVHKAFNGLVSSLQPYPPVIRPVENMMGRIAFYQPLTIGVPSLLSGPFVKIEQ